jgi:CRP-like cAMP-binding protein
MLPGVPGPGVTAISLSLAECPYEGTTMANAHPTPIGNLLLDAFPPDVREALMAGSTVRRIAAGDVLVNVGDEVTKTFFPTSGTLSLLAEPDENSVVEAATIGREGAGDVFAALGALRSVHRLIAQVPGQVLVVDAKVVRDHALVPGRPQTLLFSYIQALFAQAAISVACIGKHHVDQRAARWLLQTHDRADGDSFQLKQEFLAFMLGTARPTVSLAAATLKNAGLVDYSRGTVTIVDRDGLESVACSCYEQIRKQYSLLVEL